MVLHARLSVGGTELMGADIPNAEPMRSADLSLGVDSDAEAERIFSALSDGGRVFMPAPASWRSRENPFRVFAARCIVDSSEPSAGPQVRRTT
jgi:hypothetical protein